MLFRYPLIFGLLFALVLMAGPANAEVDSEKPVVRFGVFAYLGYEQTKARYEPIIDYLNEAIPEIQVDIVMLDLDEFEQALAQQALDILTTNPTHFVLIRHRYPLSGAIATLVNLDAGGHPVSQLSGVIVTTPEHDEINELQDLPTRTIAVPSLSHMGGFRAQQFEILQAGIPWQLSEYRLLEAGSHHASIRALLNGEAEVAFIRSGILERLFKTGELAPGQIKVINPVPHHNFQFLASTRLYPEWPVVALPHTDERVVRQIASALFSLEPDHPAAVAARIYGYTIPADYNMVESLARELKLPPFDSIEPIRIGDIWQAWRWQSVAGLLIILLLLSMLMLLISMYGQLRRSREQLLRSSQQLAQRNLQLQTILDNIPGFVYQLKVDSQGNYRYEFVTEGVQLLGITPEQVLADASRLMDRIHKDDTGWVHEGIQACKQKMTTWRGTFRMVDLTGQVFWIECRERPQATAEGSTIWTGFAMDVTDRVEMQRKMVAAGEEAQKANQAKSEFLASMSHEIRTPMNGVIGMTQLLLDTSLTEEQAGYVEVMQSSGNALLNLINDILDISKIEAGRLELEFIEFSFDDWLKELLQVHAPLARQKGLRFFCSKPEDLPRTVCGDPNRLRQILTNLISNSLKFTTEGRIEFTVTEISRNGHQIRVRLEVRDTGIGIPREMAKKLFNKFEQGDRSMNRIYGGSGLGLSIARQLVELMGGDIGFDSILGKGSTFWVELNLKAPADQAFCAKVSATQNRFRVDIHTSSMSEGSDRPSQIRRFKYDGRYEDEDIRVLVADDNAVNRRVASATLLRLGIRADVVSSGHEAIQKLATIPYDIVLMDIQMPMLDGFETTRAIRSPHSKSLNPDVPIIAMTAHTLDEHIDQCHQAGMNDHLGKPIQIHSLVATIDRWLKKDLAAD